MKQVKYLITGVLICSSFFASAQTEILQDGLKYKVVDGEFLRLVNVSDKLKGELVIPDSVFVEGIDRSLPVRELARHSFNECDSIYSVVFPHTLESYESPLFFFCRGLKKVDMGKSQVTELPDNTLGCMLTLEDLILPPILYSIGDGALSGFMYETYKVPETLKLIGESAFQQAKLKEIDFGNAPVSIYNYAFYKCTNLSKVKWSKSMTDFGRKSFSQTAITDIVIYKSVKSILFAFTEIKTLKNVYCMYENPEDLWIRDAFDFSDLSDCILWVPNGSEELYRNHEEWQDFKEVRGFDPAKLDAISANPERCATESSDLTGRPVTTPRPGQVYIEGSQKKIVLP